MWLVNSVWFSNFGYINTKWESDSVDGMSAMLAAWKCNQIAEDTNTSMTNMDDMNCSRKYLVTHGN